jgi:UDP-2,4-diacetamido-2,4,6-trideoxy-beta-L-altropyranose hydrolase
MRPAYVLIEGGKKIGMGHIIRQFALCKLLKIENKVKVFLKTDWTIEEAKRMDLSFKNLFFVKNIDDALEKIPANALVLIDAYNLDIAKINQTKKIKNWQIIFVADEHKEVPDCEVLINHLPWIKNNDYPRALIAKKLLGPKYAILRKPFYFVKKIPSKNRVFICLGGSVVEKQIKNIYSSLLENGVPSTKIDILYNKPIQGIPSKNLHFNLNAKQVYTLISKSDICLITPGNISYEVFSINRPTIMGHISEDQKIIAEKFYKMGLCSNIGDWNKTDFTNLKLLTKKTIATKHAQKKLFTDLNNQNILKELSSIIN